MIGVYSDDLTGSQVHNVMPDGTTSSAAAFTHINLQFVDEDTYLPCIMGRPVSTTEGKDAFTGIVNEMRFYSDEVLLTDLQALVSNTCNHPCPVCLAADAPTCVEADGDAVLMEWDFVQVPYTNPIPDTGTAGLDIDLLDDQTSYDPIFVDNQGMYFDSTSHMRTGNPFAQNDQNSYTIEGWLRPTEENLDGDILTFEAATNNNDVRIGFDRENIEVQINGVSSYIPITYGAADVGEWHYVGVSIHKVNDTQSRVCGVFGSSAEFCTMIEEVVTLQAAGDAIQIGNKFNGFIETLRVLDYPKVDYEFTNEVQTAGCTNFNGAACNMCPSDTGACISN